MVDIDVMASDLVYYIGREVFRHAHESEVEVN